MNSCMVSTRSIRFTPLWDLLRQKMNHINQLQQGWALGALGTHESLRPMSPMSPMRPIDPRHFANALI